MKNHLLLTLFLSFVMVFLPFLSIKTDLSGVIENKLSKENNKNDTIIIETSENNSQTEEDLFTYIVGTVAAEMPASFEIEALKAQAVAAYTYQKYIREHGDNTLSDSGEIHQAYKTEDELRSLWGAKYESYYEKISSAVESVFGEYLSYEGETALTLYHALSTGTTESAENVFGKKVPYLVSVNAPGDRLSPDYMKETVLSKNEFSDILVTEKIISSSSETFDLSINKNDNFASTVKIGEKVLEREKIRELFSLKSPYFMLKEENDSFVFTVYGKGHGVGMSQYSADYMARQGYTYKEILSHFYKGTEIAK